MSHLGLQELTSPEGANVETLPFLKVEVALVYMPGFVPILAFILAAIALMAAFNTVQPVRHKSKVSNIFCLVSFLSIVCLEIESTLGLRITVFYGQKPSSAKTSPTLGS
jgi:hypothetical protein